MQQQQRSSQSSLNLKSTTISSQKQQLRPTSSVQVSGSQAQSGAVHKTDQIISQLHTLASNAQAQTENTEKLQCRLQKSEEAMQFQKKQNQTLRMENGKIMEQLRLSTCSMEQLEVQVQTLLSNVQDQKCTTQEIQEKLCYSEKRYEECKSWKECLESRLTRNNEVLAEICAAKEKKEEEFQSALAARELEIKEANEQRDTAQKAIEDMKSQLVRKDTAITRLQSDIKDLNEREAEQAKVIQNVNIELEQCNERIKTLVNEKLAACNNIISLQKEMELNNSRAEIALQEMKQQMDLKIENLVRQNILDLRSLQDKLTEAEILASEKSVELEERDIKIHECIQKIALGEAELKDSTERAEKIRRELDVALARSIELEMERVSFEQQQCLNADNWLQAEILCGLRFKELESVSCGLEQKFSQIVLHVTNSQEKLTALNKEKANQQDKYGEYLAESNGKLVESASKISSLEKQLLEADQKANDKIKHHLIGAQKHLEERVASIRQENLKASTAFEMEIQNLREKLNASEKEIELMKVSVRAKETAEAQNEQLFEQLALKNAEIERMASDLEKQRLKFLAVEKDTNSPARPHKSVMSPSYESDRDSRHNFSAPCGTPPVSSMDYEDQCSSAMTVRKSSRLSGMEKLAVEPFHPETIAEDQTLSQSQHESGAKKKRTIVTGKSKHASKKLSHKSLEHASEFDLFSSKI